MENIVSVYLIFLV